MRVITTVRGTMKESDPEKAKEVHNSIFGRLNPVGQALGSIGHQRSGSNRITTGSSRGSQTRSTSAREATRT